MPAGFNRGGLDSLGGRSGPVVVQAREPDSRDRDDPYVNINPIASFPNEGLVIFDKMWYSNKQTLLWIESMFDV